MNVLQILQKRQDRGPLFAQVQVNLKNMKISFLSPLHSKNTVEKTAFFALKSGGDLKESAGGARGSRKKQLITVF